MKVKHAKKEPKKTFFDTKGKMIGAIITASVIFIIIVVLMISESILGGKLIIDNKTDLNLEYVNTKYVIDNDDLTDFITYDGIKANHTFTTSIDPINLSSFHAYCKIAFKFENYNEMYVEAGLFSTKFTGDMNITFAKSEDANKLIMTVTADNGFIPSRLIQCDDEFTIDLDTGKAYEND